MIVSLSILAISCGVIEQPSLPLPTATISPPVIPHSIEGRADCRACHADGVGGAPKFPVNHVNRPSDLCLSCHDSSRVSIAEVPLQDLTASPYFASKEDSETTTVPTQSTETEAVTPPIETTTTEISAKELYDTKCTPCHGANREGLSGLAPALTPASLEDLSDNKIRNALLNGRPSTAMPAFKDTLSPGEIDALLQFIKSPTP